ncbi:enoyl-CoA hydratase/isomerase family protein [Rhodococcus sp. 14-2483-1-2]|uniref:enoyl-CoA hydratase/isomerase family protein n=1 Tax=Rhodococcus sp. 14-2483-1-2 TaxID=2023147 RepID=UPI0011401E19|nr:enoyl-CoA hydratase/isomerase family protein [Rhodococcus sp. 14-2483-1-2]
MTDRHEVARALTTKFDHFSVEFVERVAVLRIDRPDKLNAIAPVFWSQLRGLIGEFEQDEEVRAVVITGAGDVAFSAGGDLAAFGEDAGIRERRDYMIDAMKGFAAVENASLPIIAAVNGWALGGGCELTMACDFVIASETAQFGMPEAGVGLVPGFGILRAPSIIGRQWTKYMVFANVRIDAGQAFTLGMVQKVVPQEELLTSALDIAARVTEQAPLALSVGKEVIGRGVDSGEFSHAVDALTVLFSTHDLVEGVTAFAERRAPRFEGR